MDISCEYAKFGCKSRLANEDHLAVHLRDSASYHLKLVTYAFEKEVEKNKILDDKLDAIYKMLRDSASRGTFVCFFSLVLQVSYREH